MKKTENGCIPLGPETAAKLICRHVAPGLKVARATTSGDAAIYLARTGDLEIRCENDWAQRNGRIKLTVSSGPGGGGITLYFLPHRLTRDKEMEEAARRQEREYAGLRWVLTAGADHCHQLVDQYWAGV